jgi:hypothetical protein
MGFATRGNSRSNASMKNTLSLALALTVSLSASAFADLSKIV